MTGGSFSSAFAKALRRQRVARGFSQEHLAQAAGLARQYVGMIERGERMPTVTVGYSLARALGLPLSALVREAEKTVERSAS